MNLETINLEGTDVEELTIEKPAEVETPSMGGTGAGDYRVILYNDDWHSQDEVVLQLQKATGCDLHAAVAIMMEAHLRGRAPCYKGSRDECHRVARVLREIYLQVEVDCD